MAQKRGCGVTIWGNRRQSATFARPNSRVKMSEGTTAPGVVTADEAAMQESLM